MNFHPSDPVRREEIRQQLIDPDAIEELVEAEMARWRQTRRVRLQRLQEALNRENEEPQ